MLLYMSYTNPAEERGKCHVGTGNVYDSQPYPTDILHSGKFTFRPVNYKLIVDSN